MSISDEPDYHRSNLKKRKLKHVVMSICHLPSCKHVLPYIHAMLLTKFILNGKKLRGQNRTNVLSHVGIAMYSVFVYFNGNHA